MRASKPAAARFIAPMLVLRAETLPEGKLWSYELKLDGYRAVAFKSGGRAYLRSRNDRDFSKYAAVVSALAGLPDETVVDGELVAFYESGRPSFNALQNHNSATIVYYLFDVTILCGRSLMEEPLSKRREQLQRHVLPKLDEPIRYCAPFEAALPDLVDAVRAQRFEGIIAKQLDSVYESGERSGAWRKMRINQGQEFVIGGYTMGGSTFDALIFGYYEGGRLLYAARTRSGFTPVVREQLLRRFRGLESDECPFSNLPEKGGGRWGQGLTAAKMKECRWLKPVLVAQFEFVEWTPDRHLRHSRFVALRGDKDPCEVRPEE